ncbi:family 16 glycoside hydrolase [Undibacterium sp. Di24W]|uniref:family 16 glycoside hydrolase n=1 Tax=Undibacterium sp. Di24W TaxID=3413033 RepID=UPI003BF39C8F
MKSSFRTISNLGAGMLLSFSLLGSSMAQARQAHDSATAQTSSSPQLSVQLWSVKDDVSKDFEGTLKKLAAMGFQGVEFAGNFGPYKDDAPGLKRFLDKTGLKASGAHVGIAQLNPDNFAKLVKFYQDIGCNKLIVPSDSRAGDPVGVKLLAQDLSSLSKQLKPFGMQIGFHNHSVEMNAFEGKTYWDAIAQNTPHEVILQQDVGWTSYAGKDPVLFVKRYPGRTLTTHYKSKLPLKPLSSQNGKSYTTIIGQDNIDWDALYQANVQVGGTEWIVVEQEEYPNGLSPMQSVEQSLRGLQAVIAVRKVGTGKPLNTLTSTEQANGWKLLFDGKSTQGWHGYGKPTIGSAWKIYQGELQLDISKKDGWQTSGGGDIVTDEQFDNFHLQLEWKLQKNGNSGIFLYVNEDAKQFPYAWNTGLEMQVLDNDGHADGKIFKHRAGDLYDLIAATQAAALAPGLWNQVDIVSDHGELNFYLNSRHIVNTQLWTGAWKELVKQSKFGSMPGFGEAKKGRIGLQDHGDAVSFRNIKIRSL